MRTKCGLTKIVPGALGVGPVLASSVEVGIVCGRINCMQPTASSHSPDGRWWWDGSQWLPAWSADGRNWFDGTRWAPVSRHLRGGPRDWARRVVIPLVLWLGALSAFPTAVLIAVRGLAPDEVLADNVLVRLAVVGGVCLATTPVLGFLLGRERRWLQTVWAAVIGTGLLTAWYVGLFLADQSDPSADNEAGAGVAIFALPTFAALLGLLAMGSGVARGLAWLRARHGSAVDATA
jgi:hypothetical protein